MNRSDFLAQLKRALESELSANEVKEHLDYYNKYIQEEMKSGKSEQEVIDVLGDPWAIAKTVLLSSGMNHQEYSTHTSDVQEKNRDYRNEPKVHIFGLDSWWKKAVVIAAVVAVIAIIFSIIMGIIRLVAPIIIPVFVIILIMKMWKK